MSSIRSPLPDFAKPPLEDKEPAWLRPTAQKLTELSDLPENWDSYGARPIDHSAIAFAVQLLSETMQADTPAPAVVPTNRGGVQLEWHTRGIDLEIEIQSPGRILVSYEDHRSGKEWEAELTSDLTRLSDAISELLSDEPAHAVAFGEKPKRTQRKLAKGSRWVIPPSDQ
jgi:hypothetical protein